MEPYEVEVAETIPVSTAATPEPSPHSIPVPVTPHPVPNFCPKTNGKNRVNPKRRSNWKAFNKTQPPTADVAHIQNFGALQIVLLSPGRRLVGGGSC